MPDATEDRERWVPVLGYEARYEVSDLGRIRSLPKGNILRPGPSGRGYPAVSLCMNGASRKRYVHHLVAEAFIGPRVDGVEVCHENGDFKDCRASNLRYDTHHANMRDSLGHGTHRSTQQTHCSKGHRLTPENVYRRYYQSADGGQKYRDRCKACMKVKSRHDYAMRKARVRGA